MRWEKPGACDLVVSNTARKPGNEVNLMGGVLHKFHVRLLTLSRERMIALITIIKLRRLENLLIPHYYFACLLLQNIQVCY